MGTLQSVLPDILTNIIRLAPSGVKELMYVLLFCWFTFTLVGIFLACVSIIKKVMVWR